jgi:hypothetical protein
MIARERGRPHATRSALRRSASRDPQLALRGIPKVLECVPRGRPGCRATVAVRSMRHSLGRAPLYLTVPECRLGGLTSGVCEPGPADPPYPVSPSDSPLPPPRPGASRRQRPASSAAPVRLHLKPGQEGTKRLLAQYGDSLICVRYRYDAQRNRRT